MKEKIVVLTGAGISAESGINTFRGSDGLWEGHDVMEVASPEGWRRNPSLVLEFYNARRKQLHDVQPNAAHFALTKLEELYDLHIITQNVDDLHERAGNTQVTHLHGELRKVRGEKDFDHIKYWEKDVNLGDLCPKGQQLRPHIVWFGEAVPMMERAVEIIHDAHYVWIVGTSMKVYPAASLVAFAPRDAKIAYIDPNPQINHELSLLDVEVIAKKATVGLVRLVDKMISK